MDLVDPSPLTTGRALKRFLEPDFPATEACHVMTLRLVQVLSAIADAALKLVFSICDGSLGGGCFLASLGDGGPKLWVSSAWPDLARLQVAIDQLLISLTMVRLYLLNQPQ